MPGETSFCFPCHTPQEHLPMESQLNLGSEELAHCTLKMLICIAVALNVLDFKGFNEPLLFQVYAGSYFFLLVDNILTTCAEFLMLSKHSSDLTLEITAP